jgi:hypothetical protein
MIALGIVETSSETESVSETSPLAISTSYPVLRGNFKASRGAFLKGKSKIIVPHYSYIFPQPTVLIMSCLLHRVQ